MLMSPLTRSYTHSLTPRSRSGLRQCLEQALVEPQVVDATPREKPSPEQAHKAPIKRAHSAIRCRVAVASTKPCPKETRGWTANLPYTYPYCASAGGQTAPCPLRHVTEVCKLVFM